MFRLVQPAVERILALLAAFAAVLAVPAAQAQSDPFALPTGLNAQSVAANSGPGLSEISVDGDVRSRLVDLAWRDGVLTIDADGARAAGLPVPESSHGKIAVASLRLAKWHFDSFHQRLEIQLMRQSDRENLIDLTNAPKIEGRSSPLTALRLDYDVTATLARGRLDAAGLLAATLVRGNVAFSTEFQAASSPAPGTGTFLRLDSQLQVLFPRKGITATFGDYISAGGQSQRALRLGGIQIASDYSLRPDLVTAPLPSFTGQVAVPTGVDLINGDQRYKLGEVQPGEFTVRNVPANAGRGEIAIITRDSLGREVIQNARFYISRNLLAPKISQFAVNVGFVRRRYGLRSNDYGPLAASAYYRRGISPRLTLEGTAEWTSGLINIGARGDLVLGGIALASVEGRFSRDNASGTSGSQLNVSLESVGKRLSARVGATLPSSGYRDVASKLGDPLPPRQYFAQINFNLANMTQIQLSAMRERRRYDPRYPLLDLRSDVQNASFRTRISKKMDFFATFNRRQGAKTAYSIFAGLSIQLGGGRNGQTSGTGGTGNPINGSVSFSRHDIEGRPLGYSLEQTWGRSPRTAASLAWRGNFGRVEGQIEYLRGEVGVRANARGTVIVAGGGIFARNQTGGSYALVRSGSVNGVTIMRENRLAGVTSRKGLLLVENITAQVPVLFDVDPDKMPGDALARDTRRTIVVPRGAVGLVELDVVRFIPRQIRVVDSQGEPMAAGTLLKALPSGEPIMVGFEGVVDFNIGGGDNSLLSGDEGALQCLVKIDPSRLTQRADPDNLPRFECLLAAPGSVAQADRPGNRKNRHRHAGRVARMADPRRRNP